MPHLHSLRGPLQISCVLCLLAATPPTTDSAEPDSASPNKPTGKTEVVAGHSYHGEAFNEGPRQAAVLIDSLAPIAFPTSTSSDAAREYFLQGVSQLHGFWFLEAERSFRQAAKEDPKMAIAFWGMAMANTNNSKRARGLIDEAKKLRKHAGDHERLYIDALDRFLPSAKELEKDEEPQSKEEKEKASDAKKSRALRYIADLEKVLDKYPEDIEAKAFIALHLWQSERVGLKLASRYAVSALLGEVFAANPMHPAHHYRIHLWDSKRPQNALESSALCGPSSPGIAHMWHMPGHIYSRLKRYQDAAWQQEASARVDHAHMTRMRLMPDQIHNFAHNNEWLIRNLLFLGRVSEAIDQAQNLVSLPMHPKFNAPKKRGSQKYGRERLMQTLFQFELWDELIKACGGPYLTPSDDDDLQRVWMEHLAIARFMTGDKKRASKTLRSLRRRRLAIETELLDLADKAGNQNRNNQRRATLRSPLRATQTMVTKRPTPAMTPSQNQRVRNLKSDLNRYAVPSQEFRPPPPRREKTSRPSPNCLNEPSWTPSLVLDGRRCPVTSTKRSSWLSEVCVRVKIKSDRSQFWSICSGQKGIKNEPRRSLKNYDKWPPTPI